MQTDLKVGLGLLIYLGFGLAGQLVLSHAMKQMDAVTGTQSHEALRLARYIGSTPQVWLGVFLLAINFSMLLLLLSKADVSLIVPTSAASYLLLTLLAKVVLREDVSPQRWLGVALISAGVALVLVGKNVEKARKQAETQSASTVRVTPRFAGEARRLQP
jgi:multidrug transporter EmrE-like cation transporter